MTLYLKIIILFIVALQVSKQCPRTYTSAFCLLEAHPLRMASSMPSYALFFYIPALPEYKKTGQSPIYILGAYLCHRFLIQSFQSIFPDGISHFRTFRVLYSPLHLTQLYFWNNRKSMLQTDNVSNSLQ